MLTLCQRNELPASLNSVDKIKAIWREEGLRSVDSTEEIWDTDGLIV